MKKYLFISALLTILTVSIFFGIFYYQKNQPQEIIIKVNPEEQPALNYKSYIEINNNYQITRTNPEKIISYQTSLLKNILIPNTWAKEDYGETDFFASKDGGEFIYYKKFYQATNSEGELIFDSIKTSNYPLEQTLTQNLSEAEKNEIISFARQAGIQDIELNHLVRLNLALELSRNFKTKDKPPLENLDFLIKNDVTNRQISGFFKFNRTYEGNNKYIHEYISDNYFVWLLKNSDDSFIYAYGYLEKNETKDLFKILFLNLD